MSKRIERRMVMEIDGKEIALDIFLSIDQRGVRYELTSKAEIEPMDSAFILWQVVKGICREAGISPSVFTCSLDDISSTRH